MRKDKLSSFQAKKQKLLKIQKAIEEYDYVVAEHKIDSIMDMFIAKNIPDKDQPLFKDPKDFKRKEAVATIETIRKILNEK